MPSLADLVTEFLKGVADIHLSHEVFMTIMFLKSIYANGRAKAEDIVNDLTEICSIVLREKHKDWSEEQISEEAEAKAREFFRVLGVEAFSERIRTKYTGLPY